MGCLPLIPHPQNEDLTLAPFASSEVWPARVLRGPPPAAGLQGGTPILLPAFPCGGHHTPKAASLLPAGFGEQFPLPLTRLVMALALCPVPYSVHLCVMNSVSPCTPLPVVTCPGIQLPLPSTLGPESSSPCPFRGVVLAGTLDRAEMKLSLF